MTKSNSGDLTQKIEGMGPEQKAAALTVLDCLSRPLTTQEIAGCLRKRGISAARAGKVAAAVAHLHIVAIVGE